MTVNTVNPVDSLTRSREKKSMTEWRRVAGEIRQRIRDDRVRTDVYGRRWLPTYGALQAEHDTTYGTLRSALLVLEAEGWIVRRPGVGLEVAEREQDAASDHPE